MRGAFIVFEGPDGAGKSSLCKAVADALSGKGRAKGPGDLFGHNAKGFFPDELIYYLYDVPPPS